MQLLLILLVFSIAIVLIAKPFTNQGRSWGLVLEAVSTAGVSYILANIIWKIYIAFDTKSTLIFALASLLMFVVTVAGIRRLGHRFLEPASNHQSLFLKTLAYHASVLWKLVLAGEVAVYQFHPSLLNSSILGMLHCLIILSIIIESAVKMFQVSSKTTEN